MRVFEIPSGKEVATGTSGGGATYSLIWTGDGRHLVSHHANFTVRAWRADTVAEASSFGVVPYQSDAEAASPDGRWVAYPLADGSIVLRDCATWKEVRRFEGHAKGTMTVAFHPGGRVLVSAGTTGSLRFWDLGSGRLVADRPVDLGDQAKFGALGFPANGAGLIFAGPKGIHIFGPGK